MRLPDVVRVRAQPITDVRRPVAFVVRCAATKQVLFICLGAEATERTLKGQGYEFRPGGRGLWVRLA
jgi:hypothetical protein